MTTPYFSIQYLLREFAKGLGTKQLAAKKIDDTCKKLEINPHDLRILKARLIHEPLKKYVNVYFADHLLEQIDSVLDLYLNFVRNVDLDGVDAQVAQSYINKYFLSYAVSYICREMLEGMHVTPKELAWLNQSAMSLAISKNESSGDWQAYIDSCDKAQKDKLRNWCKGYNAELPDIGGIASIGERWENNNSWGTLKARLVIGRFWDHFFYRTQICDLNMIRVMEPDDYIAQTAYALKGIQLAGAIKYEKTTQYALGLFEILRLRVPKTEEGQSKCQEYLSKLGRYQKELDKNAETTYYWHWMNARYHLHSGDIEESLHSYQVAFEQVLYRAGENINCIIREAMIVACRVKQPPKVFINRLRSMAAVLRLDILPKGTLPTKKAKPELIEDWEVSAISKLFDSYFTRESFFPGAGYPPFYGDRFGIWMTGADSHQLDTKKPNKVLNVGMNGGLVKKMPQVVYYSMEDGIESVRQLLESGADVNKLSSANESALLFAVQTMQANLAPIGSMSQELFDLITSKSHDTATLSAITPKRKLSVLGCAIQTGRFDVVKKVLELGADIEQRHDVGHESPLFTCISLIGKLRRPHVAQALWEMNRYSEQSLQSVMAHSAGLLPHDKEHLKKALQKQDKDPKFQAINQAQIEYVESNVRKYLNLEELREIGKLLLEHGANPNSKHDTALHGYTPLMLAIEFDEVELVSCMLKAKGNLSDTCIDPRNRRRASCFEIARHWKSESVLRVFFNTTVH